MMKMQAITDDKLHDLAYVKVSAITACHTVWRGGCIDYQYSSHSGDGSKVI